MTRAIVLFSGGLDSTTILAWALAKGRECLALTFNYGQRHLIELDAAKKITEHYGVPQHTIVIDPSTFAKSSLVDDSEMNASNTYVPARNTLFLAYALGQAEIEGAQEIYIGPNKADIEGYPDCRPAFIEAFQNLANVATKQATDSVAPKIVAPLLDLDKKDIVEKAISLKVPLQLTHSCYDPVGNHLCGKCSACTIRHQAFQDAGITDPLEHSI